MWTRFIIIALLISNAGFAGYIYLQPEPPSEQAPVPPKRAESEANFTPQALSVAKEADKQIIALQRTQIKQLKADVALLTRQLDEQKQLLAQEKDQHSAAIADLKQSYSGQIEQLTAAASHASHEACIDSFVFANETDADGEILIGNTVQKWISQAESELLAKMEAETSPRRLFQQARQLMTLNKGKMNQTIIGKLLQNGQALDMRQQSALLMMLQNAVTPATLNDLYPFLYSPYEEVYEEAFLRLQDLGLTEQTRPYFEDTAQYGQNEWVRREAKRVLGRRGDT